MKHNKKLLAVLIGSALALTGCNSDSEDNSNAPDNGDNKVLNHTLNYAESIEATEIKTAKASYDGQTDWIYTDGTNREIILRGFNVSGTVKLFENGFQPFANETDAKVAFDSLKAKTGSNIIRYTVSWEGLNPEHGKMDGKYLANMTKFIKQAIANDIYVLVDYHSDLYSRYSFRASKSNGNTGNGAPAWASPKVFGTDVCGIPCMITWSAHKLSNAAVQEQMKNFFYNGRIETDGGEDIPMSVFNEELQKNLSIEEVDGKHIAVYGDTPVEWTLEANGLLSATLGDLGKRCATVVGTKANPFAPAILEGAEVTLEECVVEGKKYKDQRFTLTSDGLLRSVKGMNKCITPDDDGAAIVSECINTAEKPEYVYQQFIRDDEGNAVGLEDRVGFDNDKYLSQKFELTNVKTDGDVIEESDFVQDGFMWQIEQTAKHIKENLTKEEFAYIVGLDAINEPFDGDMSEMHPADFDNLIMYPLHQRVRTALNNAGWEDKDVYAEPNVFWISVDPLSATAYKDFPGKIYGGQYLDKPLGKGFVLNSHFYDQARMGIGGGAIKNATYIDQIDYIREEGRYMETPTFLSEFGMWTVSPNDKQDVNLMVTGIYQGMEASNIEQDVTNEDGSVTRSRNLDIYTPFISGTQWQWDINADDHREPIYAADPNCLDHNGDYTGEGKCEYRQTYDAWNNEKFSVITNYATEYSNLVNAKTVERAKPRALQGRLLHSVYQGQTVDHKGSTIDWYEMQFDGKPALVDTKFSFTAWRGNYSDAPTEIFIPRHFNIANTAVITADGIWMNNVVSTEPANTANEVLISKDFEGDAGHLVRIWDDSGRSTTDINFALIVEGEDLNQAELTVLRDNIKKTLEAGKSPVYLNGELTYPEGYDAE